MNMKRFKEKRLLDLEEKILSCNQKIYMIEKELFCELEKKVIEEKEKILQIANGLAIIDVTMALARAANENNYKKPVILDMGRDLKISNFRHPVVESTMDNFIKNDIHIGKDQNTMIITGPNMAGKSTILRQSAILIIMAQMGSFVPADNAEIGICDKIFVRIGASDNLVSGQSTFMVEMSESAYIVKNATKNSFVVLDEIGRGTATHDGLAIAASIIEYLTTVLKSKTIFATHYHEIDKIINDQKIQYCTMEITETEEKIIFMHKLISGKAKGSFGINVAKMAGLPKIVTDRSYALLKEILKIMVDYIFTILAGFFWIQCSNWIYYIFYESKKKYQPIREDGPKSHIQTKNMVPTMGGIGICVGFLFPFIFLKTTVFSAIILLFLCLFFAIGLIDDFLKIKKKNNNGLAIRTRLFLQFVFSFCLYWYLHDVLPPYLNIPFTNIAIYIPEFLYAMLFVFIFVGTINSANITDGIDGLLSIISVIIILVFLAIIVIKDQFDVFSISIILSIIGSICGFLIFNFHPARIFMGDSGSLFVGSIIAFIGIYKKLELYIPFVCIILFIECLSVIIQVLYFKKTKKRFFKMAPFHHHLESKSLSENKIVLIFSGITILSSVFVIFYMLA